VVDTVGDTPEISIITPCFNAAAHLADAIASVRAQEGVRIEHIVVDAASQDGTIDVLRRHPHVRWISEPDRGQSNAFNKGLAMARAPLIGWLNADDMYEPGAITTVVRFFRDHPDAFIVNGHLARVDGQGNVLEFLPAHSSAFWLRHFWFRWYGLNHPSTFYRREVFDTVGPIDERLHYAMDYDFYLRASEIYPFHDIDVLTTRMRVHPQAKTSQ
jgi:GT2 family glycosyltransferase